MRRLGWLKLGVALDKVIDFRFRQTSISNYSKFARFLNNLIYRPNYCSILYQQQLFIINYLLLKSSSRFSLIFIQISINELYLFIHNFLYFTTFFLIIRVFLINTFFLHTLTIFYIYLFIYAFQIIRVLEIYSTFFQNYYKLFRKIFVFSFYFVSQIIRVFEDCPSFSN